jgi:hypothetical protein
VGCSPVSGSVGKANDITNELLNLPKETKCENSMLLVGSNDCTSSSFNETTFQEDYTNLFQVAKLLSTLASPVSGVYCSSVSGTVTRLLVVARVTVSRRFCTSVVLILFRTTNSI